MTSHVNNVQRHGLAMERPVRPAATYECGVSLKPRAGNNLAVCMWSRRSEAPSTPGVNASYDMNHGAIV